MKKIITLLYLCFIISQSYAQSVNTSLTAKKINDELYLDYDDTEFRYGINATKINQKINTSKSFSSRNESVSLKIKSKNPILNEIIIETKTIVNDDYKKFKESLSEILTYFDNAVGFAPASTINNEKDFLDKIDTIITLMNDTNDINIAANLSTIESELESVANHIKNKQVSLDIVAPAANWYVKMKAFESNAELLLDVNSYYKILKEWKAKVDLDKFNVTNIDNISRDSIQVLDIKFIAKELKLDRENKKINLVNKSTEPVIVQLKFEKFSRFVPEVRAAVVFTDLSFPKFGTDMNDNDELVVADAGNENFNKINVGLMINFNYNIGDDEFVPFFQLGVGPTKKYPILFSGVGIRITERFMISGGAAWTWINELSSLNIGDVVSGSAAIENDERYKFVDNPNLYLSLQFKL